MPRDTFARTTLDSLIAALGGFEEPNYRRLVSDDDVLLIKLRCVDKLPFPVIAERLGWKPQTLMLRAMKLGITNKKIGRRKRNPP